MYQEGDPLTSLEFLAAAGISEETMQDLAITADKLMEEIAFSRFFPTTEDIAR